MKVIPKGIGFNGLIKLTFLAFNIFKQYGFRTLWRKFSNKFSKKEDREYPIWILKNEPSEKDLSEQKTLAEKFPYRPLISIIMPVYNPTLEVLKGSLESVLTQTYTHWQLCIADGSDSLSHSGVKNLLKEYDEKDDRIHVVFLNKNKGISGNLNKALEIAEGEFIALIDHDDQIAPFALFRIVERLNQNRDIDVLYSDRDLLSWDGQKRYHPFFKPDWSPELLVSVNYLIHLCVVRKVLVERVGGFFSEMDGAQDWDLFFRVTELTTKIVHIPEVLYHWRVGPTSAAWSLAAKPYVVKAQFQAIKNHFERDGIDVDVSLGPSGFIKIKWRGDNKKKVSILMVVQTNSQVFWKTVKSVIAKTSFPNYEIILVTIENINHKYFSNPAEDIPIHWIQWNGEVNLPNMKNKAAEKSTGEILVFLGNGLEVLDPDWLEEMSGWVEQKEIGAVGGKLLNSDGTIRTAGIQFDQGNIVYPFSGTKEYYGWYGSSEWYRNYQAVSGDCMSVKKEVFEKVGQFETNGVNDSYNLDFCFKLRKHEYRIINTPYARVKII